MGKTFACSLVLHATQVFLAAALVEAIAKSAVHGGPAPYLHFHVLEMSLLCAGLIVDMCAIFLANAQVVIIWCTLVVLRVLGLRRSTAQTFASAGSVFVASVRGWLVHNSQLLMSCRLFADSGFFCHFAGVCVGRGVHLGWGHLHV